MFPEGKSLLGLSLQASCLHTELSLVWLSSIDMGLVLFFKGPLGRMSSLIQSESPYALANTQAPI